MRLVPPILALLLLLAAPALGLPTTNGFETALTFNALLARGNTDKSELGTKLETQGDSQHFEQLRAGGMYAYGVSEGETTAKRWDLFGYARRPWEQDVTYSFVNAKIESDAVAELNYRTTEGGGMGLYLAKSDTLEWSAESGLSWIFEETEDGSDNYPAIRFGERFEKVWESGAKVVQTLELLPHVTRIDDFLVNTDVTLQTVITKALNLNTGVEYHYQSKPPEEAKSYDFRMMMGVTAKF